WTSLASLRAHGHSRPWPRGAGRGADPGALSQGDPRRRWRGGEGRRLGTAAPRVRDQEAVRGHLRRHRRAGTPAGGGRAGPPAAAERGRVAYQGGPAPATLSTSGAGHTGVAGWRTMETTVPRRAGATRRMRR